VVVADGNWHTYRLELKGHPAWRGRIGRLRLDPSNQAGGKMSIAYIRVLGPLPAKLTVQSLSSSTGIVQEGQPFTIQAVLLNTGDAPARGLRARLEVPSAMRFVADSPEVGVESLKSGEPLTLTWGVQAPTAGVYQVALWQAERLLRQSTIVVEATTPGEAVTLAGKE
jgi:hypothetical protein